MSTLREASEQYLQLRRELGYKLRAPASLLRNFVTFAERQGATHVTTDLALRLDPAYEKVSQDLTTQLAAVRDERRTTASGMPEDLMTLYEKLRAQKNGVGAAALRRRECGGCRLTLNASDLGIIAKKPSDEVVRCEECDRILVRTGESGI